MEHAPDRVGDEYEREELEASCADKEGWHRQQGCGVHGAQQLGGRVPCGTVLELGHGSLGGRAHGSTRRSPLEQPRVGHLVLKSCRAAQRPHSSLDREVYGLRKAYQDQSPKKLNCKGMEVQNVYAARAIASNSPWQNSKLPESCVPRVLIYVQHKIR